MMDPPIIGERSLILNCLDMIMMAEEMIAEIKGGTIEGKIEEMIEEMIGEMIGEIAKIEEFVGIDHK